MIMETVSRETFEEMPIDSKLNILFDIAQGQYKCSCQTEIKLIAVEKKLERKKKIDTSIAATFGFFAGLLAHIGERWLKL